MDITTLASDRRSSADVLAALVGAGFRFAAASTVRRTVLETFDGRLLKAGLRLEGRELDGYELLLSETASVSTPARVALEGLPHHAHDLPAGPFRSRLAEVLGVRALLPVLSFTTREVTATKTDRSGKTRVSVIVHDELVVDAYGRFPQTCVVELVSLTGYATDAEVTRVLLTSSGWNPVSGDLAGFVADLTGVTLARRKAAPTVPLQYEEPAAAACRRLLTHLTQTMDATWSGTVQDLDPEFLHAMRVSLRRIRSVLTLGKQVLPTTVRNRYKEGFRWLGNVTGPTRDLDVYRSQWADSVAPLGPATVASLAPVFDHLDAKRQAAHALMAQDLGSERYRCLMNGWHAWLRGPPPHAREGDRPIGEVATSQTARAQHRLLAHGRLLGPESPAEDLHQLRTDAKNLRYSLECFGSLYPPVERKAFVKLLKALQDNLGAHQDADVHLSALRAIASELPGASEHGPTEPATMSAIEQFSEHLEQRLQTARAEFAGRFSAYDTKDTRRSLKDLLRSAGESRE